MSLFVDASLRGLNDCGCCEGGAGETSAEVINRPGLPAIGYRAGTHARFMRSMVAALSASELPALSGLTTREPGDFSLALLDAWATLADLLTFYQERIANESYLRTATERLSILELARLIGYQLRPGVAASTYLAFTLDHAEGAPKKVTIDAGLKVQSIPGPGEKPQTFETVEPIEARVEWNAISPLRSAPQTLSTGMATLWLAGANLNLSAGDRVLTASQSGTGIERRLRRIAKVDIDGVGNRTTLWLEPSSIAVETKLSSSQAGVWAMRVKAAVFGHNAPQRPVVTDGTITGYTEWNRDVADAVGTVRLTLDAVYDHIRVDQDNWVVVDRPGPPGERRHILFQAQQVTLISRAAYGMAGRVTRLTLNDAWFDAGDSALTPFRDMVVFAQAEPLKQADAAAPLPVKNNVVSLQGENPGLKEGQMIVVSGPLEDAPDVKSAEVAKIDAIQKLDGITVLKLKENLEHVYRRPATTINANVARATHGESVQEVLGSGDAAEPRQRFTLRQGPLTYTSAATTSGAESTLRIRVNDVLWKEVATLYEHDPDERVFVTRAGDDGRTTVHFGSRLPTGQENVRAEYRKGIGLEGLVGADQLTLLMTRPLGLKAVTNPEAATGAKDPESLEDARRQAPLTVMTLDRAVSLRDYEDFARAFAGIGKALATWTWDRQSRGVFVTVAGPAGELIEPGSDTAVNLLSALRAAGDPYVRVRVKSYRQAFFKLAGRLYVDPDYLAVTVGAQVEAALRKEFSFDARAFGQPVALSEIMAAIHRVKGVVAVDIDDLYRTPATGDFPGPLTAAVPGPGADENDIEAAELLTLDPGPIALEVTS